MMACSSNALNGFMDSDTLSYGEEFHIPMDEFFKRFNSYCTENNYKRPNINVDMYNAQFTKYNIKVERKAMKIYMGKLLKNTNFLIGVDIIENDDADEDML
jgi:hypothetical protein